MATDALTPEKTDATKGSTHQGRVGVVVIYVIALVVVFASAIVLTLVLNSTAFFWPLTLLGAFVIAALVSAAALPYLQNSH